jgi:hypothetical protein
VRARRRAFGLGIVVAVVAQLLVAAPGAAPSARAAEFRMETAAAYQVQPGQGHVAVSIDVEFENTEPDPPGAFSLFSEVKLAIHDAAVDVAAEDSDGALEVGVAREDDVNVATVQLREGLRHEEVAELTVDYLIPDGDDPHQRVRPSLVVFGVWGFGTESEVTVSIPGGYEVRIDGDPLEAEPTPAGIRLTSGPIANPAQWLALVTASRPGSLVERTSTVPLDGGTADLHVRAFADDEEWADRMLALLAEALPRLEDEIGLPYPHVGPLVVTESVGSGADGFSEQADETEILVAFDQPEFTAIHQLAHVWLDAELVEARWAREGLASHVAERVAADLGAEPPYDPLAEREARADAAFPLDTWRTSNDPEAERYAYAASWAVVREIADLVGDDGLRQALQRAADGVGPYQPARSEVSDPRGEALALDSRGFLDQLDRLGPSSVSELFATYVFSPEDAELLDRRAAARDALDALLDAAGDWGAPDGVRSTMRAWSFSEALGQISAARAWIEERDVLLARMEELGLSAPERLRDAYLVQGGAADAATELAAEAAVVDAYGVALDRVNAGRSLLERLGLVGAPDPAGHLTVANGLFADGDLRAAADAIEDAERQLAAAATTGITRLVSVLVALALAVVLIVVLARRRRPGERG